MLLVDSPARLCLNRRSRGDIAQLIERSIRIAEVEGLNPSISTRCYYIFIATSHIPVAIFIIHVGEASRQCLVPPPPPLRSQIVLLKTIEFKIP